MTKDWAQARFPEGMVWWYDGKIGGPGGLVGLVLNAAEKALNEGDGLMALPNKADRDDPLRTKEAFMRASLLAGAEVIGSPEVEIAPTGTVN